MKTLRATTLLLVLLAVTALAADPATWFDLEGCGMCKHLLEDPQLFEAMNWETHLLKDGMLEVTIYPDGYGERFDAFMATMENESQRQMAGEQIPLCNMCRSYGTLMMSGADMEHVMLDSGVATIITSDDPAVAQQIRDHALTTQKAYAMMLAAEEHGHDHHGHDHHHAH